ncbi:MAG: peptidoglycan DD-metalloendopeptidase family protein [Alphaproteobacteria bacterium]|nr:peptidoglycan DD-metalloendopeptidase family protein [Alphaproteobacteria bacterium]
MLQFTTPRTRIFSTSRPHRRSAPGLRHAVLSLLAVAVVSLGIWSFMKKDAPAAAAPAVHTAAAQTATPFSTSPGPQDAPVAVSAKSAPVSNMKAAFAATPVAPSYQYGTPDAPAPQAVHPSRRIALIAGDDALSSADETDAQQAAAVEPAAGSAAPARPAVPAISRQLAVIQNGIHKILQASGAFMSQRHVMVGKGDTLIDLLVKNDVPRDDAFNAIEALRKVYDPRDLNIGHKITVFFHNDPTADDPEFNGLRIQKDLVSSVTVRRGDDGAFTAKEAEKPVHRELRAFSGKIDNSLYVSAKAQGVPDAVILEMIKMYSWGVDFQREIQGGNTFDVLYEDYVTDDGQSAPGRGKILYANLGLNDRAMPLYRYEDAQGNVEYFDPAGQSVKKPLMRTPVNSTHIRISSRFGMRYHPILGYSKMHKGIDFAVPRGTPIYAAGDGVIERIGPWSTYGNYVRIRHRRGLETAYAHMKGFRAGLRRGSHVKQGQVIGYVGTTGRSTGPHLHYEILINGRQVNPATVKVAGGRALHGKDLHKFKAIVARVKGEFDKLEQPASAPAVASAAGLPTPEHAPAR